MATKKFSEFDSVPTPVLGDIEIVGLDDAGQNARFPGSAFGGADAWGEITGTLSDQTDLQAALDAKEPGLGNPASNGYVLASTTGGTRSWVAQAASAAWGAITGTLSAQTDLQSALDAKEDDLGNPASNGYVLSSTTGGTRSWVAQAAGTAWGAITGTLADQTDLQAALEAKLATASVDSSITSFALPDNTTISTFGATLTDDTTNTLARRTLSANPDRFFYKPSPTTPIFIVITGQSNPEGLENSVVDFPLNTNVWDYESTVASGAPPQSTDPAVNFSWRNPDPSETVVANITPVLVPYVGYTRGGRGHQGMTLAAALQEATGRDVYVLSICSGAAALTQWEAGAGGLVRILLESFVPYVLANTPALADVTAPDIIVWGQSESNAAGAGYTAPKTYADDWKAVFAAAEGIWYDPEITSVYLTEPTQWWNWIRTNALIRWEGINAVDRYTPENVHFVSSVGLANTVLNDGIHYTGDANNEYGRRIASAVLSHNPAKGAPSVELERDALPILGGDLDGNGYDITGVATLDLSGPAGTGGEHTSPPNAPIVFSGDQTYDFATVTLPGIFDDARIFTIQQSAGVFGMGSYFYPTVTIKNDPAVAANFSTYGLIGGTITFTADTQAITMGAQIGISDPTVFATENGGTLVVNLYYSHLISCTLDAGVTVNTRFGCIMGNHTGGGTVNSTVGYASNLTTSTNITHFLGGSGTAPSGKFNIYQADTSVNRLNGGMIMPWRPQSTTVAAVSVKGDNKLIFMNGSSSTITLPTLTSMTTGHTAAQMSGYELVIINDRTTDVVSGTDFLLGAGTNFGFGGTLTIAAKQSRIFVWNGVDTWL